MSGKAATATELGKRVASFRVANDNIQRHDELVYVSLPSTTKPKVPSLPMKSFVRSGPAEDFLARDLVLITSPFGSTIFRLKTFSRIVPYRTAIHFSDRYNFKADNCIPLVPEELVL